MPTVTSEPPAPSAAPPPEDRDAMTQTLALIQPWIEYIPKQQRRLGLFIAFAFGLHLILFRVVRIDITRAELHPESRPHVALEDTSVPSLDTFSPNDVFWDRLTDPRLFILPLQPSPASLPSDDPLPDFGSSTASLSDHAMPAAVRPEDFRFARPLITPLTQRVADSFHPARQPFTYEISAPPQGTKTVWQWDDDLARREPVNIPDLPEPVSDTELSPTELRLAVGPAGNVEHVFVEQSCGNADVALARDLDQQAIVAARKLRFRATGAPGLTWGRATIFWAYTAKPREEVVPLATPQTNAAPQ